MKVLRLEPAHVDAIVAMGGQLTAESPVMREYPFDVNRTREYVEQAADPENPYQAGWVIDTGDELAGFMLGQASEHNFMDVCTVWDGALYIKPSFRGKTGRAVVSLVLNYTRWGKQFGGPIFVGDTVGVDGDIMRRLYTRLGFETIGTFMRYR